MDSNDTIIQIFFSADLGHSKLSDMVIAIQVRERMAACMKPHDNTWRAHARVLVSRTINREL